MDSENRQTGLLMKMNEQKEKKVNRINGQRQTKSNATRHPWTNLSLNVSVDLVFIFFKKKQFYSNF